MDFSYLINYTDGGKKPYLASIESLEDCGDEELNVNIATINNNAMDDGNISTNCLKLRHIERVIMEIVETERTYVQDLSEIIEGYLIYLKKFINQSSSSSSSPSTSSSSSTSSSNSSLPTSTSTSPSSSPKKCFICLDQLNNLFGNIEDIFEFNSKFLSQLEECDLIPSRIAKCFVQQSKGFEVYTQYCTNYPRTVSLLTHLMTNKETAEIFRERQLFLKHSLPLGSYLLKPVQRILKYHLLLQNIVKDEEEDIDDIRQALSVMTNIAAHINEMKRKHEHAVRVQEIQSLLCGWMGQDLTTYGELVAEGSFRMLGAKAVRHLFLFEKMLLITKKKEDGLLCYKALIMCSNLMVIESIEGEPFCFQVIPFDSPRTQYTFQSRNLDHKREWCLQLKRLMLENYPMPIPSNAKQIVMKLGLTSNYGFKSSGSGSGKESKSSYSSVGSGRRTPSAPEYLEKRKQERRKSDADSHSTSNSLHKGFKLRKSLKKIQPSFDLTMMNGSKRSRSASTDETAMNLLKREEQLKIDRRSSLGTIKPASLQEEEMNNSQSGNISLTCCDVKTINNHETIATTTLTSSSSLPSPIFSTNSITTICPMSIVTCSTTTLSTTTTSSNSSLASLEKSLTDNVDGERSYWSGLRRSSSRCSARKLANDYLKRASISEACGDDYVSFYFCGNGLVRRDSINGSTSSNGVATLGEEDKLSVGNLDPSSIHGYSLSSGSSMASMVSSTASESNSIMCICKAYRQLNLRSTPKQTQSLSSSNSSSTSSSTTSFTSTDGNNVTGSNVQIVESPYDEYIPCLCGSTCEQRSRLFNSNSGEDSGLGSIFSGSSSNSSFSARTSTPLSAGSSELSMASSSHSSTDDYHHILSNLTGAVGRLGLTNDHSSSNHLNNPHNVRRAQSFTGMVKTKTALLTHTLSFRHSPQLDLTPCCNLTHHHQYNQHHGHQHNHHPHHHHHHHHHSGNNQKTHHYHHHHQQKNPNHSHQHHQSNNHRSPLQTNHYSSQQPCHPEQEQSTRMEQVGQNCHENDEQLANSHSDDSPDISCSSSSSHHHHSTPSSTCSSSQTSSTTTFSSSPFTSPSLSNVSFSRNSSNVRLPSSTSLEEMSPTSPEIWLRKQEEHFPPACKKGGSLPRSFESTAFTSSSQL